MLIISCSKHQPMKSEKPSRSSLWNITADLHPSMPCGCTGNGVLVGGMTGTGVLVGNGSGGVGGGVLVWNTGSSVASGVASVSWAGGRDPLPFRCRSAGKKGQRKDRVKQESEGESGGYQGQSAFCHNVLLWGVVKMVWSRPSLQVIGISGHTLCLFVCVTYV